MFKYRKRFSLRDLITFLEFCLLPQYVLISVKTNASGFMSFTLCRLAFYPYSLLFIIGVFLVNTENLFPSMRQRDRKKQRITITKLISKIDCRRNFEITRQKATSYEIKIVTKITFCTEAAIFFSVSESFKIQMCVFSCSTICKIIK